jgi:hypothetical protein
VAGAAAPRSRDARAYVTVAVCGNFRAQGFTDARGVFDAGALGGSFSVVGEKDGSYALVRR